MVQYRQHVTEIEQRIPVYVAYVLLQRQDILDQRGDRGSRQGITHRDVDTPDLLRYGVQHRDQQMFIGKITAVRRASSELISASLHQSLNRV